MELGDLMKANFRYTQLVERKVELSLELSRTELAIHNRYPEGHGQFDPEYTTPREPLPVKRSRLEAEYDSVCGQIDQLKQDLRRNDYELTPLEAGASTVRG